MNSIYSLLYSSQTLTDTSASDKAATPGSAGSLSQTLSRGAAAAGAMKPTLGEAHSWYEAMAKAWGQALNQQAHVITELSDQVTNAGQDQPSQITQLTAESMRFSYIATNASTATTSVGEALQTLGRKQ
jgi:uncharacterized protein YukE